MTQTHTSTVVLPPDIHRELFSLVLDSEEFRAWRKAEGRWQLRVIGGPGTGKTTFASLAVSELESQRNLTPTAAIFMRYGCSLPARTIVAEVLSSMSRQLLPHWQSEENRYEDLVQEAPHDDEALDRIRQHLKAVLSRAGRAFLVIDGLDQCGHEAWFRLEEELSKLKDSGLSILAVSRVPFGRGSMSRVFCDRCSEEDLKVYWQCRSCHADGYMVCDDCKVDGNICPEHQLVFSVLYDRVYYDIGNGTGSLIKEYIRWDLEREHGDLGLGSANDHKPPASSLGKCLVRYSSAHAAEELVARIAEKADGDFIQARLRLDLVREAKTIADTEFAIDRLPDSVTALFDAGVKSIQKQEEPFCTVGLIAVCLVTESDVYQGVEAKHFLGRLQDLCNKGGMDASGSLSLDGVLHACRGLLSAVPHNGDEDTTVLAYHRNFWFYVSENYNEVLSAIMRGIVAN